MHASNSEEGHKWQTYIDFRVEMSAPSEYKREQFRKRLETTVKLIKKREEFNPNFDPNFDEADYPTPYFIMNVAMQCAPINFKEVENRYRRNVSVDDMMVELYDRGGEPAPSFQFATFTPHPPPTNS